MTSVTTKCEYCGDVAVTRRRGGPTQRFCTWPKPCRDLFYRDEKKRSRAEYRTRNPRICRGCGVHPVDGPRSQYCGDSCRPAGTVQRLDRRGRYRSRVKPRVRGWLSPSEMPALVAKREFKPTDRVCQHPRCQLGVRLDMDPATTRLIERCSAGHEAFVQTRGHRTHDQRRELETEIARQVSVERSPERCRAGRPASDAMRRDFRKEDRAA